MDSDKTEYEVERVLDRRIRGSRVEYYVKWKGYPIEQATWEPIHNLRRALKSIVRFEKTARLVAQRRKQRRAQLTSNPLRSRKTHRPQDKIEAKKFNSFIDDVETIVIDSDGEVQKHESEDYFSQINHLVANMNFQFESEDEKMATQLKGSNESLVEKAEKPVKVPPVGTSQKFEVQEDSVYVAKYKDGTVVTLTKQELIKKHPEEFEKFSRDQGKSEV